MCFSATEMTTKLHFSIHPQRYCVVSYSNNNRFITISWVATDFNYLYSITSLDYITRHADSHTSTPKTFWATTEKCWSCGYLEEWFVGLFYRQCFKKLFQNIWFSTVMVLSYSSVHITVELPKHPPSTCVLVTANRSLTTQLIICACAFVCVFVSVCWGVSEFVIY